MGKLLVKLSSGSRFLREVSIIRYMQRIWWKRIGPKVGDSPEAGSKKCLDSSEALSLTDTLRNVANFLILHISCGKESSKNWSREVASLFQVEMSPDKHWQELQPTETCHAELKLSSYLAAFGARCERGDTIFSFTTAMSDNEAQSQSQQDSPASKRDSVTTHK